MVISLLILVAGSQIDDGWPPLRYRRDTWAHVQFVDPRKVGAYCGDDETGVITEACQDGFNITMPNPCTYPAGDEYARLMCHEIGHVDGWSENHPGSTSAP